MFHIKKEKKAKSKRGSKKESKETDPLADSDDEQEEVEEVCINLFKMFSGLKAFKVKFWIVTILFSFQKI